MTNLGLTCIHRLFNGFVFATKLHLSEQRSYLEAANFLAISYLLLNTGFGP